MAALSPPKELPNRIVMKRFLESAAMEVGACHNVEPFSHIYAAFERWCSKKTVARMGKIAFARELRA